MIILVLTADQEPWRTLEVQGLRTTWAASNDEERAIFWLHGRINGMNRFWVRAGGKVVQMFGSKRMLANYRNRIGSWAAARPVTQERDRVLTQVPESYLNTNAKTVAGLRHLLASQEFDYVLRTNTSTYVNRDILASYVARLPTHGYYGGFINESGGVRFASGTCILLSRDTAEMIASDPMWEYNFVDDVAIGRSMQRAGIEIQPFDRLDVRTQERVDDLDINTLQSVFIVWCKGLTNREQDVAAMRRVHELYRQAGLA